MKRIAVLSLYTRKSIPNKHMAQDKNLFRNCCRQNLQTKTPGVPLSVKPIVWRNKFLPWDTKYWLFVRTFMCIYDNSLIHILDL